MWPLAISYRCPLVEQKSIVTAFSNARCVVRQSWRTCGSAPLLFAGCNRRATVERSGRQGLLMVCMAHPRRVAKVAKQIEREVGNLLLHDRVLQEAVCPERGRGIDSALSALASVTEVNLSNDLQVAKVYISVFSDEHGKEIAIKRLMGLQGYVRKHIGKQIRLRLTPEIRFIHDDSLERGERVLKLLQQIKQDELVGEDEVPAPSSVAVRSLGAPDHDDDAGSDDRQSVQAKGHKEDHTAEEEEEGGFFGDIQHDVSTPPSSYRGRHRPRPPRISRLKSPRRA